MNIAVAGFTPHASAAHPHEPISRAEALKAQRQWAEMLIEIGEVYRIGGDYRAQAEELIAGIYDFRRGPVLMKPAFAAGHPVRTDFADVVSYYVGGGVWEDAGFALKPWRKVRFGRQFTSFGQGAATLMGACYLTPFRSVIETRLDFTMGFRRDAGGVVRLQTHHSSVPCRPARGLQAAA